MLAGNGFGADFAMGGCDAAGTLVRDDDILVGIGFGAAFAMGGWAAAGGALDFGVPMPANAGFAAAAGDEAPFDDVALADAGGAMGGNAAADDDSGLACDVGAKRPEP